MVRAKKSKGEVKEEVKEAAVEESADNHTEDVKKDVPEVDSSGWVPKTRLGREVKAGEISSLDPVLDSGMKIMEAEITDRLLPGLEIEFMMIGQSKGKFGGGQRRIFKQVQKKTSEGNKPRFAVCVAIGNCDGIVGIGLGKSRETMPARDKAIRNAKLAVFKIRRGCGSWECGCGEPHTIPFRVEGKCGSVTIKLMPAPKGTGLRCDKECQKILKLAGISDIWSKTYGQARSKINIIMACEAALRRLVKTRVRQDYYETLGITEGPAAKTEQACEATAESANSGEGNDE
ncbi:30S ribosomal protein S5 [Candidatus Woesearchaeota archaeon CG08_land_8_20_14_0_20_47_9]|nr:MAG: 30S ribosomal protein S5 [Candidatus Woesearchaeota archaeon CG1_02_47_18]PIN72427.1 MAG: 30S ribosomal protein S5 [Candidatus Woesearchaeota archaeon CG10_big_fil_rev_8_21_14_0_10_47_5]PIO04101.1 MAG: 30S ribosomal protein S5 [Candidatus Woesearchaeota archaeon CG08_land_8_20_14_0_20_47_9]HII29793.1 30S ribosomal protein S5 [Candidatus Woesearchaeota archaeon]